MRSAAIVVGGGIAGAMTALSLTRRKVSTTLIDRWEPGHSRASSTDYNRVIRSIHGHDEFYTRWARESRERWLELQAETGQRLYYECGALVLATEGHCDWEDATAETFQKLGVPFHRFSPDDIAVRFPQFDPSSVAYGLYEPEAGMVMAHRAVITAVDLFRKAGGKVARGRVEDRPQRAPGPRRQATGSRPHRGGDRRLDGRNVPRTVKPISSVVGVNVLYTSTPDGSTAFDYENMPCWIDHGEGSFGLLSTEGSGVKAAVVIPDTIDLDRDERLIRRQTLSRTRAYIRKRLPGLIDQPVVDSKFNQIVLTPDTHFIVDPPPGARQRAARWRLLGSPVQARSGLR